MKKWIAVMLAGMMTAGALTGCGSSQTVVTENPAETEEEAGTDEEAQAEDAAAFDFPHGNLSGSVSLADLVLYVGYGGILIENLIASGLDVLVHPAAGHDCEQGAQDKDEKEEESKKG